MNAPAEVSPRWRWLESTLVLQRDTYHVDPGMDVAAQCKYLDWNLTAAGQELAEVREEFAWKPWATDEPFVNRDRVIAECVDVLHFVGNILTGVGCDDLELWDAYREKQEKNKRRQASGTYSARKGGISEGSEVE